MSAQPRITDKQIAFARYTMNRRRELRRQLEMIPTLEELAEEFECSERYLEKIVNNHARIVPRETTARPNIEELAESLR